MITFSPLTPLPIPPTDGPGYAAEGRAFLDALYNMVTEQNGLVTELNAGLVGEGAQSTYAFAVADTSGNSSPTTVTGRVIEFGPFIFVSVRSLTDIDTTGLVQTDELRLPLPMTQLANHRGMGQINIRDLASVSGTGTQFMVRPIEGGVFASVINVGGISGSRTLLVSDLQSGVTNIPDLTILYPKA